MTTTDTPSAQSDSDIAAYVVIHYFQEQFRSRYAKVIPVKHTYVFLTVL